MHDIKENYTFEAKRPDGTVFTTGGDISGCVRFSLVPAAGTGLPRHDFVGVQMVRRFCRCFKKVRFAGREMLPGVIFWEDGKDVLPTSEDLTGHLAIGDYVGKGVAGEDWYLVSDIGPEQITLLSPYRGITKKNGLPGRRLDHGAMQSSEQYVHCVETQANRFWINYATGSVLVTPKEYELSL